MPSKNKVLTKRDKIVKINYGIKTDNNMNQINNENTSQPPPPAYYQNSNARPPSNDHYHHQNHSLETSHLQTFDLNRNHSLSSLNANNHVRTSSINQSSHIPPFGRFSHQNHTERDFLNSSNSDEVER